MMLDRILEYFQHYEPSHPAPIFIRRTKEMIGMDFYSIVEEILPEAVITLKQFTGKTNLPFRWGYLNGQRCELAKFIGRNNAPRVQIEYDVEIYGSNKKVELPFVTGVMADLSGHRAKPLPAVEDRKFLTFDQDNFDARMSN